jgi:hypothetical protein
VNGDVVVSLAALSSLLVVVAVVVVVVVVVGMLLTFQSPRGSPRRVENL